MLKAQNSAKPVRKNHRTRHRNLHIATIHIFEELYKASDILQSNSLDGKNVYIWLMERRNQVNYRERVFHDPKCPVFWSSIAEEIDHKNLNDLISKYVDDTNYIYCFQKEDACLALPIKRAMLTKEDMLKENCKTKIPNEKLKLLKALYKKTEKLDFLFE